MPKNPQEDPAKEHFDSNTTDRERAIFEGAITLGAIYHQFVGASIHDPKVLERAMEKTATAQPFTESAEVKITPDSGKKESPYEYPELTGKMLEIGILAKYGEAQVELGMQYVPELDYPLMFIKTLNP
ncbi:hypothetical protein AKJ42_01805 [candidate division MSBL1 archaeon SCGC-AAA261C02]|uniref:Dihydroneopterin aldolase n=1 Tax=candidate division MSBL1 archaeon SCGC-AAA261C02 TaxID=1698272 RepID=A0A133V0U8_9EURY|nr:hypothetical protein AKJ42_01805 [candidate division MSBL1 archaeon SCGC-AAA261C02]